MVRRINQKEKKIFNKEYFDRNDAKEKISSLLGDLQLLENYTNELFAFFPLPLCFVSPLGVILEVNPAFEKISGYKIYEIIGKPIEGFFGEKIIKEISQELSEKGFIEEREVDFLPKDKKKLAVSIFSRIRKAEKEEVIGYFITFFNLSSVKKSEKELKKSQEALLNILEDTEEARSLAEAERNKTRATLLSLVDGLIVFDKEKRINLVNPEAERILDFKEGQVLGKKIEQLYKFPNLLQLYQVLGKKLKWTGQRYELVLEKPLKRFFQVKIVPVTTSGEEKGLMVILHDITRDKEIDRLKSEFVSIAAHQLRTPLSAVKWTLRMLLDGDLGNLSVKQAEFLARGYESNEKMIILVNDLLNVARIEEGRLRYEYSFCFIEKLIEKAINQVKEQAQKRAVEIIFKKPKQSLPEMKIDCRSIELVLQNLLNNAVVYNKPGGIVKILVSYDKMELKVEITDTGIGIPSVEKDRIFTKFFRTNNAIKSDTEGSGLGLFICKNIIESHGGKIWFESEEDKGTSFFFTLPVEKKFEEFLKKF